MRIDETAYVSHSFKCDTKTRELGEAYPVVKIADDAIRQARKCIELLRKTQHAGLRGCADELDLALADVLHDASWAYWVDEARDAYGEARVRPIKAK